MSNSKIVPINDARKDLDGWGFGDDPMTREQREKAIAKNKELLGSPFSYPSAAMTGKPHQLFPARPAKS